jgi:hypothetical protein
MTTVLSLRSPDGVPEPGSGDLRMTGSDREDALRQALRIGPVLAVAAVAGYLMAGCGGGDLSGVTGLSGAEVPTGSLPSLTLPTLPGRTETAAGTTAEAPTTPSGPTNTQPTTTASETEAAPTTTSNVPTETEPSDDNGLLGWLALAIAAARGETTTSPPETNTGTSPTETVAAEPASSETSTPWGWIVLAVALAVAAGVVGFVVWRRRRAGTASWSSQLADLARRSLVVTDDVVREGSVATGQVQALASEARSLEGRAADDRSRTSAARLRERLEELVGTLEADRALRLSSPPPSEEQLSYSTALIREQVTQLQDVLQPPANEPPA